MDLRELDLNLLVVFNQLLVDKRVSIVAERLGITQPAVSNALKRLRKALGDDLFVRTARGMEATTFAQQLAEPVAYALGTIHNAINHQLRFDPMASSRKFTVAMTDIGEIYFLPALMGALERAAPDIRISTVRSSAASLHEDMQAGGIDLAIGLLPQLQAGFFQRRLFRLRYVCMFRQGHPVARDPMTLETFTSLDHVVVEAPDTGHGQVDELMVRKGISRHVRLTVPHFVAVAHILQGTDMVATVPERFATRCVAPFGLACAPHPVDLPEIAINMFWHARHHRDPGNMWLRRLIFDTFAEQSPPVADH